MLAENFYLKYAGFGCFDRVFCDGEDASGADSGSGMAFKFPLFQNKLLNSRLAGDAVCVDSGDAVSVGSAELFVERFSMSGADGSA